MKETKEDKIMNEITEFCRIVKVVNVVLRMSVFYLE